VIPPRERGACHDTLLVVIGGHDSGQMIANRILEAALTQQSGFLRHQIVKRLERTHPQDKYACM
jgi:hypothetical protein